MDRIRGESEAMTVEARTVAELLDALERGKIGYKAAMQWLEIDSFYDLLDTAHLNGRVLPGHKSTRVSRETIELLREACARE